MDAHDDKISCSNSHAFSPLIENDQCLPSKSDVLVDRDPKHKENINERNGESDVICQISSVSEHTNDDSSKLRNSDNEISTCVHDINKDKDKESNLIHEGHNDEGSKNSESEVGDKLLKDFENNIKTSEDSQESNKDQEILSNISEETQDGEGSKNSGSEVGDKLLKGFEYNIKASEDSHESNKDQEILSNYSEEIQDDDNFDKGSKNSESEVGDKLLKDFEYNIKTSENSQKSNKDQEILSNTSEEIQDGDCSKNSGREVGDKLLKDFEYNIKASEDSQESNKNQEILSNSDKEIQDGENSKNCENGKKVLLEDGGNKGNLNKNNSELVIESALCRDAMNIKTTEKHPVHQTLEELTMSCDNTTPIPISLNVLDINIFRGENVSENQSRDTQESLNINRASGEGEDKSIVNAFETDNIESSDTSALMKLAELACETNDTVASEMLESYDNTLKVNESDSNDIQNIETICNIDATALEMENDEILPTNPISGQEFDSKNTSDKVIGLSLEKIAVLSNSENNNLKSKSNDSSVKDSGGENAKIISSKSETEALISENLENEKVNSSVKEAGNLTPEKKNGVQEISSNFHIPNITNEIMNMNELAECGNSLVTEHVENVDYLSKSCNALNIAVDENTGIENSDVNGAKINLEQQESIKIPQSKSNLGNIAIMNEQKEKLLSQEKKSNNENVKEANSLSVSEDDEICVGESVKSGITVSNISVESQKQLNIETILSHKDPNEQSNSLNKENNFEIIERSVTDLPVPSVKIKNASDTYCKDVGKDSLVSNVYCEKIKTTKESSEEINKEIKNNSNSSEENMSYPSVTKSFSHSSAAVLEQKSVMEQQNCHSSVMEEISHSSSGIKNSLEENSFSSERKNGLCSSASEDKSQNSLIKDTPPHESNIKCTFLKESTLHCTSTENNSHLALTESSSSCSSKTNNNAQFLIKENISHSSETESNLQSSLMENDSHSSEIESNLHSSEIKNTLHSSVKESNSNSSEMVINLHSSVKEKDSHALEKENNLFPSLKENDSHSSEMEDNFHPSMKENDSHSSEMRKNLHNSEKENHSHSLVKENNGPSLSKLDSHSSELETDAHSSVTKNSLPSIFYENPDSSVNQTTKEHTQIVSNSSSSCPKIFIRKDLHEGYSCDDSKSIKDSLNEKINLAVTNVRKTSVKFSENNTKRALSVMDENDENCIKRMRSVLNLTCSEESSDEDKLIIDEERTNLKYIDQFSKDKNQKEKDYKSKNKKPNSNLESLLKLKNQTSIVNCSTNAKSENKSQSISNASNLKPMVEVVDLVGDELNEDSTNKSAANLNNDKNFICEKCKNIWNDRTLKLLFEGNESVTVNSRITYGAIICMNIYVSIHYPKIKEQALLGLLDRADLAKNLGSIQVSLLNSWLVALIKNKKISCCDPFRPVYRAKTPGQVNHSDNVQIGNNELNDKQKQSVESSVRERNLSPDTINQTNSTTEIVIDDDIYLNQEHEERNMQYVDSEISLAPGKHYIKKVGSSLKTGSTVLDSKGGVLTNGKAFTKQFAKSNPISYSIIQRERESLSNDLLDAYNKLVYEAKLTEEEAITGKRKFLTNKEILCMHSIFILNAKEILLDKYYRFLFQLLHHRGSILLIPDEKSLVQRIESIRKERNRMKFSAAKNKAFLSQSWDIDNICTAPVAKPINKKNEFNVKIQDILSVFCAWKNRKLLNGNTDTYDLREEVLKLYENKIEINDCFGLCIKLYANYSRLLFSQNETENMKTKVFLNLFYLPNKYLSTLEDTLIFDPEITYFPPTNGNSSEIIDYLEKQTKKGNGPVKRSYLDSVIDAKLQQAKRLKTDLLNSVKTPKTISLIESYAKLKNELNYLEVEPANHQSFKSAEDSQEENLIKSLTFTPEVKLMVANLRASNVDTEYIPIILEKVFHNILKRKIPTL